MAWKKRFKSFRTRASGSYHGARKRYGGQSKGILGASMPYIAGFVIGMTNFDKTIPAEIKLGVACAPSGLMRGGLGVAQKFAQGLVLGDIVQLKTGFTLGGGNGSTTNTDGAL